MSETELPKTQGQKKEVSSNYYTAAAIALFWRRLLL